VLRRGGALRVVLPGTEVEDHRRDVVDPAGAVRRADEPLDRLLRVGRLPEHGRDLAVADHPGQPVGREQDPVAVADLQDPLVDLDRPVDAECPRQDAAVRVGLRLRLGDLTLLDHPVHEGVVLGQHLEPTVAEQVRARVADVREAHLFAVDERGGEGGPHPLNLAVGSRALEDRAVRLLDLLREVALPRGEQPAHGVERQVRGDLPAAVPAHPVGDRVERLLDEVGVLVALADLADVGGGPDRDPHRRSSSTVLPTLTTSPAWTSTGCVTFRSLRNVPFVEPMSSTYQAPSSP
jgi:hypothetical protein